MARSKVVLSGEESSELERRINASTVAVRERQRAEIVVLSAAGVPQHQIATRVGASRVTVNLWCQGFLARLPSVKLSKRHYTSSFSGIRGAKATGYGEKAI